MLRGAACCMCSCVATDITIVIISVLYIAAWKLACQIDLQDSSTLRNMLAVYC
jgi:hypothetical protein